MYTRYLQLPKSSFFLFGPRGTGKSTWLKQSLGKALWYDLLQESTYLKFLNDPDLLSREVQSQESTWVVVDEIQRVPSLLNAIHSLMFKFDERYQFALTGSSARKLKHKDSNMLAGRAISRNCFPLTSAELGGHFNVHQVLSFGTLPRVFTLASSPNKPLAISTLESYVTTYLEVEIQREAQLRKFESFVRFLKIAAIMHGQILNISQTASDARIARTTAGGYFEILVDTLIGFLLPAWQTRAKVKEVQHPRFYLFDPGIVRAITGRLRDPVGDEEQGRLLEGFILHEIRAYMSYQDCGGELSYWRTSDGAEVDLIWRRGDLVVGIEVKSAGKWIKKFQRGLRALGEVIPKLKKYGVYLGDNSLVFDDTSVFPLKFFLERLWEGKLIG
jgi:uncharacterized protein